MKNSKFIEALKKISCQKTLECALIEREIVTMLGADCLLPIGVHCSRESSGLTSVSAAIYSPNRSILANISDICEKNTQKISLKVIEKLLNLGANEILAELGLKQLNLKS